MLVNKKYDYETVTKKLLIVTLFDQIGLEAAEISVIKDYVLLVMELSKF